MQLYCVLFKQKAEIKQRTSLHQTKL